MTIQILYDIIYLASSHKRGLFYATLKISYPLCVLVGETPNPLQSFKVRLIMSKNSSINLDKRAKRNREISIRVNDYELLELKKRNRGSTVASWLRDIALGVTPVKPVDPELVRQLGRIGSNLNQLTRHVNTERQVDAQVLHEIKAIREQMHLLIESSIQASKRSARENHDR